MTDRRDELLLAFHARRPPGSITARRVDGTHVDWPSGRPLLNPQRPQTNDFTNFTRAIGHTFGPTFAQAVAPQVEREIAHVDATLARLATP